MKKHIIIMTLVIMSFVSSMAQSANEIAVPLSDPTKRGKLKVHINYGSVTVKGSARKDLLVKYSQGDEDKEHEDDDDRHKKSSKDGLKRISGGSLELEISEDDNSVKVESSSWSKKLNLTIEVPSGFDLNVSTYNDGDLQISNIQGALELSDYNGSITAENISGSVLATSYNGEIKITFDKVTESTPMSFSTYNGDIDLTFPSSL